MSTNNLNNLQAFIAVAREGSFTRAAAQLGVSQSAISHTVTALENQLGIRLLTRSTRSVSTTEAGERLFHTLSPHFDEIEAGLAALSELRDKPAGTIRITTAENAANTVLWPKLKDFLPNYPEIKVEISIDYRFTDIVAQRFDAGVRIGDQVEKDMIAVRISPDLRMAVVGTPEYFKGKHSIPKLPQDLMQHTCINLRLPNYDEVLPWDFEKAGKTINVRVDGQLTFNSSEQNLRAALAGHGLAWLPEGMILEHVKRNRLKRVLEDWCQPFSGYHLYYPSRKQSSLAFRLVVEALRYRA